MEARRIAVYLSPGWHDFWAVTWEIFHETFRGILRTAEICLLGHAGFTRIKLYCEEKGLTFRHIPEVPTLLGLKTLVRPDLLLVFTKEIGPVYEYGINAAAVKIPTLIKLRLTPE